MISLFQLSDSGKLRLIVGLTLLSNALIFFIYWDKMDSGASASFPYRMHRFDDGDIVLRKGKGFVSDLFTSVSASDRSFSHAGIYLNFDNRDYVMHVRQEQAGPALVAEPLERFWDVRNCEAGAVYRIKNLNPDTRKKLRTDLFKDLSSGVEFDSEFSLLTSKRNYCTEWIWRKFGKVCPGSDYFSISRAGDFTYIAPDDLYKHPTTELVYHFESDKP